VQYNLGNALSHEGKFDVAVETYERALAKKPDFLEALDHEGAFIGRSPDEAYRVVCDERVNDERDAHLGTVRILVAIAAVRAGEFHSYLISHNAAVSRVRPASLNRFFFPKRTS
jgi:tetratricopeptide (TPR) repeat protein